MAIEAKITLNRQQYVQELEQVKSKTEQSAVSMQDSARKAGEDFSRVGGAVSALGGAVGQSFGAIGQSISALAAGPVGILLAAISAVIAAATWLWDKLTVSAEEYKAALSAQADALKQQERLIDLQEKQADKYMKRLEALSKFESLSNNEKKEAKKLVDMLAKSYGDLGIHIDKTTGKITGLDDAQKNAAKQTLQRRINLLQMEQKIQQGLVEASVRTYADETYSDLNLNYFYLEEQLRAKLNNMTPEELQAEVGRQMSYKYNQADEDIMNALKEIAQANAKRIELKYRAAELNADLLALDNEREEKPKDNSEKSVREAVETMQFTNALTQRGGFATGGRMETLNDINRRIANASAQTSKTLQQINAKMDNIDRVRL